MTDNDDDYNLFIDTLDFKVGGIQYNFEKDIKTKYDTDAFYVYKKETAFEKYQTDIMLRASLRNRCDLWYFFY